MNERVSANELEVIYKIRHKLLDFTDRMKRRMIENVKEKGDSWEQCSVDYLKAKLIESYRNELWVNVANYAFMLEDTEFAGYGNECPLVLSSNKNNQKVKKP